MPATKLKKSTKPETTSVSGLEIQYIHPDLLQAHPRNVRVHPEANILAVVKSLQKFGQRTPIVVWHDENNLEDIFILKGNGTHEAIKRLGWDKIAIVDASHLPPEEAEAYAIADNKTSDMSHFDFSKLAEVMRDIEGKGVSLDSTGFQQYEIEPLLQATFNAGAPGVMPGEGNNEADGKKLTLTGEQYEIIKAALGPIREVETEFDVSTDVAAITALCYRMTEQSLKWKVNVPF